MASAGSTSNRRIITGDLNLEERHPEEQRCYEFVFRLFRENKVEIASAIPKPFPFLMGLRDRGFISESMFENFQEACRNLVPVESVMYKALSELEKKFDKTVLEALFSKVNLKAYPDLLQICNSFKNVIHDNFYYQTIDEGETKEMLNLQLNQEQVSLEHSSLQTNSVRGFESMPRLLPYYRQENSNAWDEEWPQEASSFSPRCVLVTCDPKAPQMPPEGEAEEVLSLLPAEEGEDNNACCVIHEEEVPQEAPSSPPRCEPDKEGVLSALMSCDPEASQMSDKEEQEELPSQPLDGEEGSGTCFEICDEEETQEFLSSPPKSGPETELPVFGNECSCVMCFRKEVRRVPEERIESMQDGDNRDTADLGNNSAVRKPKRRRSKSACNFICF
uniref:HSR domain-containing protein n=1 Tax=Capra hircus TaxID=9925 RepID=A0A8C2ND05_CAPHI